MREEHVNNAVSFLTNPSVQDASESQRLDFLRNKGLTQEEIDEAYKRANDSSNNSNKTNTLAAGTGPSSSGNGGPDLQGNDGAPMQQQQQHQQQQMYRQPPPQPMWARYLIPGTLALSASAGLAFLYRTMVLHERNGGGGPPFGNFGSFMGLGGPAHQGMQPPPHMPPNAITNGPPSQPPLPIAPQNNTGMYGQAPYGMAGIPAPVGQVPPAAASVAAAGETQLVPKATDSLAPGLTPLPQGQLDRLAKAMEKQTEMTTKVCETVQEVMKASAKQQAEHIAASASKDAALLKALLASQSTQTATNEIRAELASIKALVLSTLKGDASTAALAQAVTDTTKTDVVSEAVITNTLPESPNVQATGGISSSEGVSTSKTVAPVVDASADQVVETDEMQSEHQATKDKHIKASREALAKMCFAAENKADLAKGLNMLLMYIGNLRKDPDVPRFRRIARQNSNYKKSLESLEGHVDFLRSLGFVEKSGGYSGRSSGGVLEWSEDWLLSTTDWANDVLDDAITNLETVKRDVNDGIKAAREGAVAASSGATGASAGVRGAGLSASSVSGTSAVGSAATNTTGASYAAVAESIKPATDPSVAVSQSSAEMQVAHAVISSGEETKSSDPGTVPVPDIAAAAAAQPMSYVDVMKMVQEGKTPPGVKQIPNKLTGDAQELTGQASSTPPRKPWETAGEQQANDVVVDAD